MALDAADELLACPVCRARLDVGDRIVACPNGHRFDVAKQGYLNLLMTAPPANADTAAMVAARARFLATGAYGPVADEVNAHLGDVTGPVAEVGAGTAWYLAQVLAAHPGSRGVALDVSVAAARRAAGAHPRAASVVADTWRSLPLLDGSVAAVLCVFAPRNPVEFRRVLRPRGVVVVVHPNPGHLARLRASYGLLAVDPAKQERLAAQLSGLDVASSIVRYQVEATAEQVSDVVSMGPNAFHGHLAATAAGILDVDVTVVTARAN